jgi:hypothetical protein
MEIGKFWVTAYLPDSSQEEIPHMDVQTLIAWEENRMPQKPRKQWGYGLLFIICIACAAFLFLFHESLPLPYPLAPISFLCAGIIFYVLGVMKYKARRSRLREEQKHCPHCGKMMDEWVVDMHRNQLEKADLSKRGLLHRFIVKEKLLEGRDGRVYMTGQKSYAPGMGYPGWKRTGFLLKAKWLACTDCQYSIMQDTLFEAIAKTDAEIEALVKDNEQIA